MLGGASPEAQEVDSPLVILKSGLNVCPDNSLALGVGTVFPADLFILGQIGVDEEDGPESGQSGAPTWFSNSSPMFSVPGHKVPVTYSFLPGTGPMESGFYSVASG